MYLENEIWCDWLSADVDHIVIVTGMKGEFDEMPIKQKPKKKDKSKRYIETPSPLKKTHTKKLQ